MGSLQVKINLFVDWRWSEAMYDEVTKYLFELGIQLEIRRYNFI